MKILAIRGFNLASLEGNFELDFEQGALSQAGVFAITGPTGAGKSTILDAMCLALFDTTPRLSQQTRAKVGATQDDGKQLMATDPRGVLRRGAVEGWAEVDFRGKDGHRYRARWSVRLARRKVDGKPQNQEMELLDLESGALVSTHGKRGVLTAIQERLGLGFDQFRRSALLAQNEFNAFLAAKPGERASLLEVMTSSEIYGTLSKLAFEKNKALREERDQLKLRLEAQGVRGAEDRALLEQRVEEARAAVAAAWARLEQARGLRHWHEVRESLERGVQEATLKRDTAAKGLEHQGALSQLLAEIGAVEALRPLTLALDNARQGSEKAAQALAQAEAGVGLRRGALEALDEDLQRALAEAEAARLAHEAALPALAAARRLDPIIAERRRALADREANLTTKQAFTRQRRDSRFDIEAGLEQKQREILANDQELAARSTYREAAENWTMLQPRLRDWVQAQLTLEKEKRAAERLTETQKLRQSEVDGLGRAQIVRQNRRDELASKHREVSAGYDPAHRAEVQRRLQDAGARRALADLAELAQRRIDEAHDAARAAQGEREQALREAATAQAEQVELSAALTVARAGLAAARQAAERARVAHGAEGLRAALRPDEPCPVCGSPEHPWAEGSPLVALMGQLQADAANAEDECRQLEAREVEAGATRAARLRAAAEAGAREEAAVAKEAEARGQWPLAAGESPAAVRAEAEAAAHAAEAELADIDTLSAQAEALRLELETCDQALIQGQTALMAALSTLAQVESSLRDRTTAARQKEQDIAKAEGMLNPRMPAGWRAKADRPKALETEVEAGVEAVKRLLTTRELLEGQRHTAENQLEAARAAETAAVAAEAEARQAQAVAETALALPLQERRSHLDDRSVDEVEAPLLQAMRTTAAEADAARERRAAGAEALAKSEGNHGQTRRALAEAEVQFQKAEAELAEALPGVGVDEAELRRRLGHDPSTVQNWRKNLEGLRSELDLAVGAVTARQADLDAHIQQQPESSAADSLRAVVEGEAAHKAAQAELARQEVELARDDTARAHAAGLQAELAARETADAPWVELNALLGSADGQRFREFAQGLTLEALVEHANLRLETINRRYRLERIPDQNLELQVVDLDMGGETRSLNSLSGGETFLVSLALALGLSDMSATETQVESLFIDEGFGTLDRASLDQAVAALEALQASGRQVGVISHVGGLAEQVGVQVQVVKEGAGRSRILLP